MQYLTFLGQGLRFPFRFSERTGGTEESSELDRIRESIIQILETRPGERFMRPEFGARVKDLAFEQNDAVLRGLLRFHITDAIKRWERRVGSPMCPLTIRLKRSMPIGCLCASRTGSSSRRSKGILSGRS